MSSLALQHGAEAPEDWFSKSHLKMRHLAILASLGDTRSVVRTAQQLHTSQPAISKSLAEIETAAKTRLFERRSRGTWPTPAGEILVRHAREIFGSLERAGAEMQALATGLDGFLSIGCSFSSAAWLAPRSVIEMQRTAPAMRISVREGTLEGLLDALRARKLDIVLARRPPASEGLQIKELFEEPMSIVCASTHPIAGKKRVKWSDLGSFPWVMPLSDGPVRGGLQAVLEAHSITPRRSHIECTSILTNHLLLKELNAFAVLPTSVAAQLSVGGLFSIVPLPLPLVFGTICAITLSGRDHSPAMKSYLTSINRILTDAKRAIQP